MEATVLAAIDAQGSNKEREADVETRRCLLTALQLLCVSKVSRQVLRSKRAYPIIRNMDLAESDETNKEIVVHIVNFLVRDEEDGDNEDILGEGSHRELPPSSDGTGSDDLPQGAGNEAQRQADRAEILSKTRDVLDADAGTEMNSVD
mmetsp:Transcript_49541/g.84764  ORF Transcript_49541/g.84764 Transcript_49541/m.84764 type:complete len:148 (-) Transcript_49541:102-545(-)